MFLIFTTLLVIVLA